MASKKKTRTHKKGDFKSSPTKSIWKLLNILHLEKLR